MDNPEILDPLFRGAVSAIDAGDPNFTPPPDFDLPASFFERPGAVDFFSGEAQLFLDGELGIDAAEGFCFA